MHEPLAPFPTHPIQEPAQPPLPVGTRVGPYTLLAVLGEGGMGVVYLAEQQAPLGRRVALKVMKQGLDAQHFVRRFESERQALALMSHPGIAHVLDAGSTDDGRPYFVMEHVAGLPLVDFCDQQRLDNRQRLKLFVAVCQAVQHAHQKGIIHRDLKPSNILVSMTDEGPAPKIIDFGVAKAVEQRFLERTAFTQQGVIVGTPEYMSPEQADGGIDVDTTSDLYSLGVVLYRLLTGASPFDTAVLRRASGGELQRLLRDWEPQPPSMRVASIDGDSTQAATQRRTDVQSLRRQLRGDLDWITLKAMDKDRARRYASASELAADIERHLAGEPVLARPPGVGYRLGKFVARHRFAVAAGALVAVALVLGIAGTSVGLMRARRAEAEARRAGEAAEREAAQAKAVNDFLREVLGSADARQQGPDVKVVDALKKAVERIDSGAGLRPELEAAVRTTIGATYQNLGDLALAEKQIRAGLAIRLRELGPEDPDTLTSQNALLEVLQAAGRIEEALEVGRQTLALRRKVLGAEHPETTVTMNDLSVALSRAGQDDEAEQLLREAVAIRERVLGPDDARTLVAVGNLANLLGRRGKRAEALETTRHVLEAQRRILGAEHSNTVYTLTTYAGLLYDEGKLEEAEPIYREAIAASRRVSGSRHVDTLILANDFGLLFLDRGQLAEAEALLREAAHGAQATLPPGHVFTAGYRRNLGRCLTRAGRYREAEAELLAAHAAFRAAGAEGRRGSEAVVKRLVELYDAWGKRAKATAYRKRLPASS